MRSPWQSPDKERGEGRVGLCATAASRGGAEEEGGRGDAWEEGGTPGIFRVTEAKRDLVLQKGGRNTILNAAVSKSKTVIVAGM